MKVVILASGLANPNERKAVELEWKKKLRKGYRISIHIFKHNTIMGVSKRQDGRWCELCMIPFTVSLEVGDIGSYRQITGAPVLIYSSSFHWVEKCKNFKID